MVSLCQVSGSSPGWAVRSKTAVREGRMCRDAWDDLVGASTYKIPYDRLVGAYPYQIMPGMERSITSGGLG